jgi:chorismate mutase-like protein
MTGTERTLSQLRDEIDRLDDQLMDLLLSRARLVDEIGPLKGASGAPILRPGREAMILRRLLDRAGDGFDRAAITHIWREIISAGVRQQGAFSVAASMPDDGSSCWALARDHFGISAPITAMAGPAQVVGAVVHGEVTAGVVPYPASDDPEPWWTRLLSDAAPRVVAHLPAAIGLSPAQGCPEGLLLAMMPPEPSGQDRTLIAFESVGGLGRSRLRAILEARGLPVCATWSHRWAGPEQNEAILAAVDGFVPADANVLTDLAADCGEGFLRLVVIGAYAEPCRIDTRNGGPSGAAGGSGS